MSEENKKKRPVRKTTKSSVRKPRAKKVDPKDVKPEVKRTKEDPKMVAINNLQQTAIQGIGKLRDTYNADLQLIGALLGAAGLDDSQKQVGENFNIRLNFIITALGQNQMLYSFPEGFRISVSNSNVVPRGVGILILNNEDDTK